MWEHFLHKGRLLIQPLRLGLLCPNKVLCHTTLRESPFISLTHSFQPCLYHCASNPLLTVHPLVNCHRRYGSKGKKKKVQEDVSFSDSDSDDEDFSDVEDLDEPDAPSSYRIMKLHVKSLRVDNIVSQGLDVARNRVDEMSFSNKLRFNGNKLMKKSKQMSVGDFIDVIKERREDKVTVRRVKVVKISSEKTRTDKHIVLVKVWKHPFEVQDTSKAKY